MASRSQICPFCPDWITVAESDTTKQWKCSINYSEQSLCSENSMKSRSVMEPASSPLLSTDFIHFSTNLGTVVFSRWHKVSKWQPKTLSKRKWKRTRGWLEHLGRSAAGIIKTVLKLISEPSATQRFTPMWSEGAFPRLGLVYFGLKSTPGCLMACRESDAHLWCSLSPWRTAASVSSGGTCAVWCERVSAPNPQRLRSSVSSLGLKAAENKTDL